MKHKNIIITGLFIALIAALIGSGAWIIATNNYIAEIELNQTIGQTYFRGYWDGYDNATRDINQDIYNSLNTQTGAGFYPFTIINGNQTLALKLGIIQ